MRKILISLLLLSSSFSSLFAESGDDEVQTADTTEAVMNSSEEKEDAESTYLRKSRYALPHKVMPRLVDAFNEGKLPVEALSDYTFIKGLTDEVDNFTYPWEETSCDIRTIKKETLIIQHWSKPQEMTEPIFSVIVVDKKSKARYFLLEKTIDFESNKDNLYCVCEWKQAGSHANYGTAEEMSVDEFIALVQKLRAKK